VQQVNTTNVRTKTQTGAAKFFLDGAVGLGLIMIWLRQYGDKTFRG
jgi:hypothetical protein